MSALSIIIPTHRRTVILAQCLEHLEKQTIADQLEVIVISDGPDEETEVLCKRNWNMPVRYTDIPKAQQGAARNQGVRLATAPLCLFIGDDIFLAPKACAIHVAAHHHHSKQIAVLGNITWDPAVGITPVMKWLEESGWQFGYSHLKPNAFIPPERQHLYTYASHLSVPTSIAKELPFREEARIYGWEDIEWGLRLASRNIGLYYAADARALHHHQLNLANSLARMETIGRAAPKFATLNPAFDRIPKGWKRLAYELSALLPTMAGKHRKAFLRGLKEMKREE